MGGGLAAWLSQGQFQPLGQVGQTTLKISLLLLQVILAMPRHQQEELTATVMDAFKRDFSGGWVGGGGKYKTFLQTRLPSSRWQWPTTPSRGRCSPALSPTSGCLSNTSLFNNLIHSFQGAGFTSEGSLKESYLIFMRKISTFSVD